MSAEEQPPESSPSTPETRPIDLLIDMNLQLALNGLQGRINAYYADSDRDPYRVGGAQLGSTQAAWTPTRLILQHLADSLLTQAVFEPLPGAGNYIIRINQLDAILENLAAQDAATLPANTELSATVAGIHKQIREAFNTHRTNEHAAADDDTALDLNAVLRALDIAYWQPTTAT